MSWNPEQYGKFQEERSRPFFDLLQLIQAKPNMQVVDLGCGTGQLTSELSKKLGAKETLGIDNSPEMLHESAAYASDTVRFISADITHYRPEQKFDLVFSNAALQWVPHHQQLLATFAAWLKKEGQLAIQVPANFDFPSHTIAENLAAKAPYVQFLHNGRPPAVLSLEQYSTLLYKLGFTKQIVRLQVYPHLLESAEGIVEWVKGSLLTYYRAVLPHKVYLQFLEEYIWLVKKHFGDERPLFFPFKRILLWAQRP